MRLSLASYRFTEQETCIGFEAVWVEAEADEVRDVATGIAESEVAVRLVGGLTSVPRPNIQYSVLTLRCEHTV